jgi:hypothetical protein
MYLVRQARRTRFAIMQVGLIEQHATICGHGAAFGMMSCAGSCFSLQGMGSAPSRLFAVMLAFLQIFLHRVRNSSPAHRSEPIRARAHGYGSHARIWRTRVKSFRLLPI